MPRCVLILSLERFRQVVICFINNEVLRVVEEKDLFARLCETLDHCPKVCSEFLAFKASIGMEMSLGDVASA